MAALAALCAMMYACSGEVSSEHRASIGNAKHGRALMERYGCGSCHTIPHVAKANGGVGPPLSGIAGRSYVGGVVANTPENLVAWIRAPQAIDPKTAMPNLGVSEEDARDIAAYLYTLE